MMDATLSDPLVDRVLDGRYAVEARLARGGMASVYLATDLRLERRVAVKVMHPALAEDPDFVARFNREARAAARLSHPDAVSVYDQGSDDGHVFLVMEYVAGATLRDVLRDRGRLTPGEAVAVMDHVLAAVGAAHAAGLVHRDIKPENVLVTTDGRVKVADFGLARAIAGSTLTTDDSMLLGTAAYLAPEQVRDGAADARSDVYSAGILLFEMLTGTAPFTGESPMSVAYQHVSDDVPAPSTRVKGIPGELDRLVAAATARDPQQRPADARALHRELSDVAGRLGLQAAVPAPPADLTQQIPRAGGAGEQPETQRTTALPPAPPDSRHRRRRRWPWIAAVLLVLCAIAGTSGWWIAVGRYTHAPALIGLAKSAAIARLQAEGLHYEMGKPVYSRTIDPGDVAQQDPLPGERVHKGATVTLQVSRGPAEYPVPDVSGEPVKAARADIKAANLDVGTVTRVYSDSVDKGLVIRTDPPAGEPLHVGRAVDLVVSKGVQPIPVPDVSGMKVDQAQKELEKAGFTVGATTQDYSESVPKDRVIRSEPGGPGVTARPGTSVDLVVSEGPPAGRGPRRHRQEPARRPRRSCTGWGSRPTSTSSRAGPTRSFGRVPRPDREPRGTRSHSSSSEAVGG